MSLETRPSVKKSLSGFAVLPNPEAHDLELALGIRFAQVPARIELGVRNRLALLAKERSVFPFRDRIDAFYDREYDAFFVRPGESNRVLDWHENMHSYTYSRRPDGLATLSDARTLLLAGLKGEYASPIRMEQVTVQATLNEGISEWAAVKTAMEVGEEYEIEKARQIDYEPRTKDKLIGGQKSPLAASQAIFKRALERLQSLLGQDPGFRTPLVFNQAVDQISRVSYYIGYNFVKESMKGLQRRGFSIPSALDHLIQYPPSRVQDLESPRKFLFDRLR